MNWLRTLKEMLFSTTHEKIILADENIRIQRTTQGYLYSLCDKEQDGTQFLQIQVILDKLWPWYNH